MLSSSHDVLVSHTRGNSSGLHTSELCRLAFYPSFHSHVESGKSGWLAQPASKYQLTQPQLLVALGSLGGPEKNSGA